MRPNIMRVGRSAYYERREPIKRYTARQLAEIEICTTCQTDPSLCDGRCEKIKALRIRK